MRRIALMLSALTLSTGIFSGCTADQVEDTAKDTANAVAEVMESEEFEQAADETHEFIRGFIKTSAEMLKKAVENTKDKGE